MLIQKRFCGPPNSGNGGYSAGVLAAALGGGAVEVTLKAPPPLETPLQVDVDGNHARLLDGESVVAEARRSVLEQPIPAPPTLDAARACAEHYAGLREHAYPTCFSCGPRRHAGDGLCIFPGPLRPGVVAAAWHVDPDLAGAGGVVPLPVLWAAIDCAGYWAGTGEVQTPMLLGRMCAVFDAAPTPGSDCVVVGWAEGRDGRKVFAGTALFESDGRCLGQSRQTWIALK